MNFANEGYKFSKEAFASNVIASTLIISSSTYYGLRYQIWTHSNSMIVSYVFKTQHFRYGRSKEEIFFRQFPVLLTYDGKKWTISPLKELESFME
jgi:hypothetical protein